MQISNCTIREWELSAEEADNSTFYHHPIWYKTWTNIFDGKRCCLRISEKGNGEFFLPFIQRKRAKGFLKEMISGPGGTYGGGFGQIQNNLIKKQLNVILKSFNLYSVLDNPLINSNEPPKHSNFHFTNILSLKNKTINSIVDKWSESHKRNLKSAIKNSLHFKIAESEDEWDVYFQLYQESIIRWSTNASNDYSRKFFHQIWKMPTKYRYLFLSKRSDDLLSGAIVFELNNKYYYWHGASSNSGLNMGSSIFLQKEIISYLISKKATHYDLGSSGGHSGTEEFKRRMNCEKIFMNRHQKKSMLLNIVKR